MEAARIDHLVIAARSLEEGMRWCEATLGVAPATGGSHPLMGTHNALLNIGSEAFPHCYLEVIAIDPRAGARRRRGQSRWFDLDDGVLQAALSQKGPRLIHLVAAVPDAQAAVQALARLRIDRGEVIEAARDTPAGRLTWQITVREDGQRLFYGALPTLIQWGAVHPTDSMAASPVALRSLSLAHPRAGDLNAALQAIALTGLAASQGPPNVRATLETPRGMVTLDSRGY